MARLRILDLAVSLRGDEEAVSPILNAYRRFLDPSLDEDECVPVTLGPSGDADPVLVGYSRFLQAMIDGVGSHALLHAAAFASPGGKATLVAAPAGYGKTTLALEMAARGFAFLGDDTAPLDLVSARVHAFPRAVGVRPGGAVPLAPPFREVVDSESTPKLLGKSLIDMTSVLGEGRVASSPLPLGCVIVLDGGQEAATGKSRRARIDAAVLEPGVQEFESALEGSAGIRFSRFGPRSGLTLFRVEAEGPALVASPLLDALESESVVFTETSWTSPPRFDGPPVATPISRRVAATVLCREMLNRRRRGRLMRRYRGDTTALFLDVAASLRPARCVRLRPGRFPETAVLVERLASDTGSG